MLSSIGPPGNRGETRNKREQGQSIIEFVLLLAVIVGISFFLRQGISRGLYVYWENYVKIIAAPSDSNINLTN